MYIIKSVVFQSLNKLDESIKITYPSRSEIASIWTITHRDIRQIKRNPISASAIVVKPTLYFTPRS